MKKKAFMVLVLLLFLGICPVPASAYDPAVGDLSKSSSTDLRVMTYNTYRQFIADSSVDNEFSRILKAIEPDVIVFEEIYWQVSIDQIESRLDGYFPGSSWTVWTGEYSGFWDGGDYVMDVCNAIASRWPLSLERWDTDPGAATRGVTMALVDLPDATYRRDLYVMGNHFKSGNDPDDEAQRQDSADAIACWLGDARDAEGAKENNISLRERTPIVILGDFNFIADNPQPDVTILTGDIQDTGRYGNPVKGDWDDTDLRDAQPEDPWTGDDDTWDSDGSPYRRFDRIYYTDSVLMLANGFILNTWSMSPSQRTAAGVGPYDTENASDHLPVVADFRLAIPATPTPSPEPAVTPFPTATPDSLLANGGFETWTVDYPNNWYVENYSAVDQESSTVHSGSYSARIYTTGYTGAYGKGLYQEQVDVAAGQRLRFSAWIWGAQDEGLGLSGYWYDGSEDWWDTVLCPGSGQWERVELTSPPAPAGVSKVRVYLRGFLDYSECGYVDDAELYVVPAATSTPPTPTPSPSPAPNLLENAGFETWLNVSTLVAWERESYGIAVTEQDYEKVFAGNYSLDLSTSGSPPAYGTGVYQDVAVSAGQAYTFSTRVNSETPGAIGISLTWYNGSSVYNDPVTNSGAAGWEKLAWSGTAPAGTTSARLLVRGFLDSSSCGTADTARFWTYEITPIPTPSPTPTPSPSSTPTLTPIPTPTIRTVPGDYDGDGTADLAIYRPCNSLWKVRSVTSLYFGGSADDPVPADYDGDGRWDPAYYRSTNGLWKVRNQTSFYFGTSDDVPVSADYDGDAAADVAYYRGSNGLWKIRGLTAFYFGSSLDEVIPADYDGDGRSDPAYYRPTNGLWKVLDRTRFYFGTSDDEPVSADYDGDGTVDYAYYRSSNGLWKVRYLTAVYFGGSDDEPVPADYDGDGTVDLGYFRASSVLWKVRGITRTYFGLSDDRQVTNPR